MRPEHLCIYGSKTVKRKHRRQSTVRGKSPAVFLDKTCSIGKKDGIEPSYFFAVVLNAINSYILGRAHVLGKGKPFAAGYSRHRANAASRQSLGQSFSLRYCKVTLCNDCRIHGRPPARGFPPRFSRALSVSPFPRMPRLLAARQKVTAYETTMRGTTPRFKS